MSKHTNAKPMPAVLILNQMAGPMTWELAEDMGDTLGQVALLTGHPDTLKKSHPHVQMFSAAAYNRGSFTQRALSWLVYWVQAFFWLWRWPKEIPLLLFSNPPILCWLGWLINVLRGTQYSVMVHDIYPDVLVRMSNFDEAHLLIRIWRWLNRHAYEKSVVVITLGEYMAETLAKQFDPTLTKLAQVKVVYPWVDTTRIKPIPKERNWFAQKYGQKDKLTVMYSGNMGLGHDIETMLDTAKRLQNNPQIHFVFIGGGPKWIVVKNAIRELSLSNVTLLGWQDEQTLPYSLAAADVALVSIESSINNLAIPSKAIYALAAGSMILCLSNDANDLGKWIEEVGAGENLLDDDSKDTLYHTLLKLDTLRLSLAREAARHLAECRYSRLSNSQAVISLVCQCSFRF